MIEYINGTIAALTPTDVVIDRGGIGYLMSITLTTFSRLEGVSEAKMLVHESIREDAHQLFGFIDERERSLFRALIGVSGVGANTARMILSAIAAPELEAVIASGDHKRLTAAKGIGAKTAQRIIVDLRDKIKPLDETLVIKSAADSEVLEEALAALVMLGFPRAAAQKTLRKVHEADPDVKVETAIKRALAMM